MRNILQFAYLCIPLQTTCSISVISTHMQLSIIICILNAEDKFRGFSGVTEQEGTLRHNLMWGSLLTVSLFD